MSTLLETTGCTAGLIIHGVVSEQKDDRGIDLVNWTDCGDGEILYPANFITGWYAVPTFDNIREATEEETKTVVSEMQKMLETETVDIDTNCGDQTPETVKNVTEDVIKTFTLNYIDNILRRQHFDVVPVVYILSNENKALNIAVIGLWNN